MTTMWCHIKALPFGMTKNYEQSCQVGSTLEKNKLYRVLLDTGSTASICTSSLAKLGETSTARKNSRTWETANGTFTTESVAKLGISLPEFSTKNIIVHTFHVAPKGLLDYDLIMGVDVMRNVGLVLDFQEKTMSWNDIVVEMPVMCRNKK